MCEICSKLTIKAPEQLQLRRFLLLTVNIERILKIILMFSLLTFNK